MLCRRMTLSSLLCLLRYVAMLRRTMAPTDVHGSAGGLAPHHQPLPLCVVPVYPPIAATSPRVLQLQQRFRPPRHAC